MQRKSIARPRTRHGFTLIELMMVVLIISILVSLLTVAVSSAMKNARVASVRAEFSSINGALSSFQGVFGKFPPSQFWVHDSPAGWALANQSPPVPGTIETKRAMATIRSLWPQFDFSILRDIDGDGTGGESHVLTGAECLVFFLGGVTGPDGVPIGFSKNPADPFDRSGTNREGPYLQTLTNPERLVDLDSDGMLEVLDPLPDQRAPVIYVSSNDGTGYTKHAGGHYPDVIVYTNDLANPTGSDMQSIYFHPNGSAPINPKSHQLISPGPDGEYGIGGPIDPNGSYSWNSNRAPESDNIVAY